MNVQSLSLTLLISLRGRKCKVIATFSTGTYEYNNVSRRAILNLILNPNMSLGFWTNENVLAKQYHNFVRLHDMNKVAFDYA